MRKTDDPRDSWINVRVTKGERALLKMAARKAKIDQSEVIRIGTKREISDILGL